MGLWTKKPAEATGEQSKSEVDSLIEKFSAAIDEKLKPLSDGFTSLKSEWDGMKAEAAKEPATDPTKDSEGNELTDTQKAERDRQALFALTVTTNARITENDVVTRMQQSWPQLVGKAQEAFQKTPWQRKAQSDYAEYCQNVVSMLVGQEALKAGARSNNGKFLIEDAAAKTGGEDSRFNNPDLTWHDENTGKTLTASEQLAKLHIDPKKFDEFMKQRVV